MRLFQIHRDPSKMLTAFIFVVGCVAVERYEKKYGVKRVHFDVCTEQDDFVEKLKSEATRLRVRGYALPYNNNGCARGWFSGWGISRSSDTGVAITVRANKRN